MFTGLIEEVGTITNINSNNISINCSFTKELEIGDSVAVNGVCLTVTQILSTEFSANISNETLKVSNFNLKKAGDKVNLERAMLPTTRLNGHLVYGHVDTTTRILDIAQHNDFYTYTFQLPQECKKNIIKKGSIAVDGISLTIADINEHNFKIAIIPHSRVLSTVQYMKIGDFVNIELDVISKYIEKMLSIYDNSSKISMEFLKENGFV